VRHSLVTAFRAMLMCHLVSACPVLGHAAVGIVSRDLQDVLLYAVAFYVLQVSHLEVVKPNRDMSAVRAVGVRAIGGSRP
jgi:hypothetical protein